MSKKSVKYALLATLAFGLMAGNAFGSSISFSDEHRYNPVSTGVWSEDLTINQFDSSNGTLTGITLDLYSKYDGNHWIKNDELVDDATLSFLYQGTVSVDFSSLLWASNYSKLYFSTGNYNNVPAGETRNGVYQDSNDQVGFASTSNAFNGFIGTGTISFASLYDGTGWLGSSVPDWDGGIEHGAGVKLVVTYDYTTPVPEPATMMLLGTGLAGLVGSRVRRKTKS